MSQIEDLFGTLADHERQFNRSFSLIPSENLISPLSRAAFLSDSFSRYFFDEHEVFGRWSFEGGSIAGRIQQEIVVPLLRELGGAEYVNLHGVSGLTGMTVALAAFGGPPGSVVCSIGVANGGHPDTRYVAEKLGYRVIDLPFADYDRVDLEALADTVARDRPSLVYLDHATALVPLPLDDVIATIRSAVVDPVHVHVDTSHVNGLVWGGQFRNPLAAGADSYGGSTHKTFPGPHKAALLCNDPDVAEKLTLTGVNMISHHHLASVVALGVSLIEFRECGGARYAEQTLRNARAFAAALADRGVLVQGDPGIGYTRTHHVWVDTADPADVYPQAERLFRAGLVTNPYNPLPGLGRPAVRMGVNEATKLGLTESGMEQLAEQFARVVVRGDPVAAVAEQVAALRQAAAPAYCFSGDQLGEALRPFAATLTDDRARYVAGFDPGPSGGDLAVPAGRGSGPAHDA